MDWPLRRPGLFIFRAHSEGAAIDQDHAVVYKAVTCGGCRKRYPPIQNAVHGGLSISSEIAARQPLVQGGHHRRISNVVHEIVHLVRVIADVIQLR